MLTKEKERSKSANIAKIRHGMSTVYSFDDLQNPVSNISFTKNRIAVYGRLPQQSWSFSDYLDGVKPHANVLDFYTYKALHVRLKAKGKQFIGSKLARKHETRPQFYFTDSERELSMEWEKKRA